MATTAGTKPRFAIYTRISKDPDGVSTAPARQEKECRALAEERGFEIVEVFCDADLSAYRRGVRRPEYERLLDVMSAGLIDGVLVWKLDRLMRQIPEFSRFWAVAQEHEITLVSKNDSIDTSTPMGLAVVYVLVGVSQQASHDTSVRLLAKERELAENGIHKGSGRRAYGLSGPVKAEDGTIVQRGWLRVIPEEAEVIGECADRLLAGESVTSVVRDLNERGIPSATGRRWTRQSLVVLMRQARLFGYREHHGQITAQGDWPAILDEATGRRLRETLKPDPSRAPTRRARRTLLSGLLRCGRCLGPMKSASGTKIKRKYVCYPKSEGGCSGTSVLAEPADRAVRDMVLLRLDSPQLKAALDAHAAGGQAHGDTELLAELADLRERSEQAAADFAAGRLGRDHYLDVFRKIDDRQRKVAMLLSERRKPEVLSGLVAEEGGLVNAWKALPLSRKRAVLDVLLDRVVVHRADSEYFMERRREALLEEASMAETQGDAVLAARRRRQAENGMGGGGSFRPERLEPIWKF